jgi:hypothetical protein
VLIVQTAATLAETVTVDVAEAANAAGAMATSARARAVRMSFFMAVFSRLSLVVCCLRFSFDLFPGRFSPREVPVRIPWVCPGCLA